MFAIVAMTVLPFDLPGHGWLAPLQRPLRIAQSWNLYGLGPNNAWVFEVWIEGEVAYRAGDDEHTWMRPAFRYRRVRPVAVNTCRESSKNAVGLAAFVVNAALAVNPEVTEVEIVCTRSPWPGLEPEETYRLTMRAPDWTPR